MGRKPEPKYPKRRDNLKRIMELEGIKGPTEMERLIYSRTGFTFQYQKIGECTKDGDDFSNLSLERAQTVIAAFPKYRLQWLMGLDDYMTEADLLAHYFTKKKEQDSKERALFCLLADLGKWTVDPSSVVGGAEYDPENETMSKTNFFSWEFENYARICSGETTESINKGEFDRLVSKVVDYFNFELEHMDKANPAR